ncbi:CPBP family intramembrane glutamic endopeptidase [Lawsonia intracellularis]|uniref:CPBP family intramembrane glutamic endopeptidase n=1 Tax=Lawsonia intracellularis TaxID=29546 RepID=UPI00214AAC59|nr:type II CAAX endopeptidase family protein [Lawsonia intracellularis]
MGYYTSYIMKNHTPSGLQVLFLVLLAVIFWAIVFGTTYINFWLGMSCSSMVLAFFSFLWGSPFHYSKFSWKVCLLGIGSAFILYSIFYLGDMIATKLLPFAQAQVADIYSIREQSNSVLIGFILLFITSPAEEIFWRGFFQRWAMTRFGDLGGWLLAGVSYAGVHIWSMNSMLIFSAAIAGLFWGLIFWRTSNLIPCIVSHSLWTLMVFVLFPILG